MKKTFKEFYEEKEELELNESAEALLGALALTGMLYGTAYAGKLLIKGAKKVTPMKLKNKWAEIKSLFGVKQKDEKDTDIDKVIDDIKNKPTVKQAVEKENELRKKYENDLSDVFEAIQEKNDQAASIALKESGVKTTPEVNRVIVSEVVDAFEEPPIHFGNTGNDVYLFIKKLLGIKVARAAAYVVQEALKKQGQELVKDM